MPVVIIPQMFQAIFHKLKVFRMKLFRLETFLSVVMLRGLAFVMSVGVTAPTSWAVIALILWSLFLILRGGYTNLDIWEQRLFLWALFSIVAFAHFIIDDPSFTGWSSIYYFCGPEYQYCTPGFRWNLLGWRKAMALWNFCLSTALAVQRLAIEIGVGGLLPGEEAVTRESFISIAWRLIPFWLNKWESNFGAECSSILFELPHFAVELLVVLPLVQIVAGRLRVVGHPHLRAQLPRDDVNNDVGNDGEINDNNDNYDRVEHRRHRHRDGNEPERRRQRGDGRLHGAHNALAPDVLRCVWINDPLQLRFLPRIRAHLRPMGIIVCITLLAACNSLFVPLALERQAYSAPRSQWLVHFEPELELIINAGNKADRAWHAKDQKFSLFADKLADIPCVFENNCPGPLSSRIISAIFKQREHEESIQRSIMGLDGFALPDSGPGADLGSSRSSSKISSELLVPIDWALQLIQEQHAPKNINEDRLSRLIFFHSSVTTDGIKSETSNESEDTVNIKGLESSGSRSKNTLEDLRAVYLNKKVARDQNFIINNATTVLHSDLAISRFYRNLHKHANEIRRMKDPEHSALVPLVEAALAIMRLSCERWFALVGVYLGYLVFRDPPPAARVVIQSVARMSTIFRRAILLSFPGICWAYGAGFLFSTFASVIFWAGPLIQGLEHIRSATASVTPKEWHDATEMEMDRAGGVCAICWGELSRNELSNNRDDNSFQNRNGKGSNDADVRCRTTGDDTQSNSEPRGQQQQQQQQQAQNRRGEREEERNEVEEQRQMAKAAGLACGHAYHWGCIVNWLQSCYSQGRTPTCPMCQTEVQLIVKYRMPISRQQHQQQEPGAGAGRHPHRHIGNENDNNNNNNDGDMYNADNAVNADDEDDLHRGLHRREPGIPGLDALVDELMDEFRHRFDVAPMGPFVLDDGDDEEEEDEDDDDDALELNDARGEPLLQQHQRHHRRGLFQRLNIFRNPLHGDREA